MELGIDLISAAKAAAGTILPAIFGPDEKGAPGVMPAPDATTSPGVPGTVISPAIQAQISPQISPTMVQQQASPGAAVQAAPTSAPGSQTAVPMGIPELPPPPMGPSQPMPQYGYAPQPMPWGTPTAMQPGFERINWTWVALGGLALAGVVMMTGRRRRRQS